MKASRNKTKTKISPCTNRNKPYQKIDHFWKMRSENCDYKETLSILEGETKKLTNRICVLIWRPWKFIRWLQFVLGWLASRNETNTMPLPSMYQFFDIEFSFEFGQKDNNFGVSFYAITFAVSISSWFDFCFNFDKNSSTLACSLMHLPPACRFLWINIGSNFDENSSILPKFLMHLPSAYRVLRIKNDVNF